MHNDYFGMHGCLERGHEFESVARNILEREGYETQKSSLEDDIYKHVDFWAVGNDGRAYGFDAKAMKSLSRGNPVQDEWAFVEWRNVYGGAGWLVRGCDILVFERESDIILMRRSALLDFCRRKTRRNVRAQRACEAMYCVYTREGRRDEISLFKFSDLDISVKVFER